MTQLNRIGQRLAESLTRYKKYEKQRQAAVAQADKVNVVGAGGAITAAYEQLRNAAENTEEHLLLQNSIKRFYKQLFMMRDAALVERSGNELAVELTLAGYIQNDSLIKTQLEATSQIATLHYKTYVELVEERKISPKLAQKWVLDTLAVEVESILNPHLLDGVFVDIAFQYFSDVLTPENVFNQKNVEDFKPGLYVAIYKALLKSNEGSIRSTILKLYSADISKVESFMSLNQQVDRLLESDTAKILYHVVDKQGAPLRILRRMIEDRVDLDEFIGKRDVFLSEYEKQVNAEYAKVGKRITRATIRSIIFLIITKVIIGVAIEVPYDLIFHNEILWLPLIVNLLFPPVYMLILRSTNSLPSYANTTALVDRIDTMLYGKRQILMKKQVSEKKYSPVFRFIYGISSLIVFALVIWILLLLQFSLVHIAIFFVFVSTASFLGFRLSRLIRELEVVHSHQNGLTFVRDLIYLPFVVLGRWLSDKYSQVNIVAVILDMVIELPMKTVLRLIRQWAAFIDDRKDSIG